MAERRRRVSVWFEENALPSAEKLTAISLGSVKIDNQEFDIEEREDEERVLSGDEPGANSAID